jgi:hypothetical protein
MSSSNLDRVRGAALDRIERGARNYRVAFWSAAALEGAFFLGFLFLADFSNRLHVLLLLAAVATYTIVGLGLVALGAHVSRCTERVLKAIEWGRTEGRGGSQP